jgi:hypothetical protein
MSGRTKGGRKAVSDDVDVQLVRSQSSVEVKRDGKGAVTMVVKAYADTVEEAEKLAAETFERLNKRFN